MKILRALGRLPARSRSKPQSQPQSQPKSGLFETKHILAQSRSEKLAEDLAVAAMAICAAAGEPDREVNVLLMPEGDFVILRFGWQVPITEAEHRIARALASIAPHHPMYAPALEERSRKTPISVDRHPMPAASSHGAMKILARGHALLEAAGEDKQTGSSS